MVPILSILCPKQPLRDVDPPFLFPDLCLFGVGWSLRRRAHIPLARVSMRKSRSNRIRERTASSRLSLSSDSRNSASSSPSKLLRDWNTDWEDQQTLAPSGKYAVQRDVQRCAFDQNRNACTRSTRLHWVRGDLNVSTFKNSVHLINDSCGARVWAEMDSGPDWPKTNCGINPEVSAMTRFDHQLPVRVLYFLSFCAINQL